MCNRFFESDYIRGVSWKWFLGKGPTINDLYSKGEEGGVGGIKRLEFSMIKVELAKDISICECQKFCHSC